MLPAISSFNLHPPPRRRLGLHRAVDRALGVGGAGQCHIEGHGFAARSVVLVGLEQRVDLLAAGLTLEVALVQAQFVDQFVPDQAIGKRQQNEADP